MNQRDRDMARRVARHLGQWISGLVALGTLALIGVLALMTHPEMLVFMLKRARCCL